MKSMTVLVLLAAIAVVALWVLRKSSKGKDVAEGQIEVVPEDKPWPFYAKRPLSQVEQVLYHRLVKALPDHIVLAQVQVSQILGVRKGNPFQEWNNRINRMSYDFVVCSKDSRVIAAIELDDKTHEKADRVKADEKKDKATASAGVKMIRWKAGALPDDQSIRSEVGGLRNTTVEEVEAA